MIVSAAHALRPFVTAVARVARIQALESMKMWGMTGSDEKHHQTTQARFEQLVEQRATSLRTKFYGAPKLLEDAMDYYRAVNSDQAQLEGQLRAIRSQAPQLANQANDKQRYLLASEYYTAAGESAKAEAARARQQQQQAQKRHKQSAEELEKELGL